ncbi:MAG: hypothetical protein QXQ18_00865 [Candidatus Aenigmatarchaeota archaeon]
MPIEYPLGPEPAGKDLKPGEGVNAVPLNAEEYLDFTAPPGKATGVYYGIVFQLPKWGFVRFKVDEWVFVSPVFKAYYDLTISQREQLQAQIKAGLASIATAISDLELLQHDLRKYKEFMDYYQLLEKGKRLKDEKLILQANQTLRSIFIDQVDAYTDLPNTPIALRSIVVRWPTIIVDFMQLKDDDLDPKKIASRLNVSEAEGVILAMKNKLFLEWRDNLFLPTVKERYENLRRLLEARRKSVEEYKEMLKPTIARYKMITDALSSPAARSDFLRSILRPDTQALSVDFMHVWAWKPFAPSEKYKITREVPLDEIPATKAGFTQSEIEEIRKKYREEKGERWKGTVKALPIEPSIDYIVRKIKEKIEKKYNVRLTAYDMLKAREELVDEFEKGLRGLQSTGGEAWVFSPYFIFVDLPIMRAVIRLPDGSEIEDLMLAPSLKTATNSQNIIIGRILELKAREKEMEIYIKQLMGEFGIKIPRDIEEIFKEEYPEIYGEPEKIREVAPPSETFRKLREKIGKFFSSLGLEISFFRAWGPYEFAMHHRLAKYYQIPSGRMFATIVDYFKSAFNVPGVRA